MLELTVTIATFKRPTLLDLALSSYASQNAQKDIFEIIICDSESGLETDEVIAKYANTINIRHYHTRNILAAKRNLGMAEAKSDFVVFSDDDCVPEKNFISKYLDIKRRNQRDTVFCGEVRFPPEWIAASSYYRFRDSLHPKYPVSQKAIGFNRIVVMNMGFWKPDFLRIIGGLNEDFIGYGCEDVELGWRLCSLGFKLVYDGPSITHYENSAGISGYMIKLHRASRDGMKSLLKHKPEAAASLKVARLLEPSVNNRIHEKIIGSLIKTIANVDFITALLIRFIDNADGLRLFNFSILYRYLMLVAIVKGIGDRDFSLKEDASKNGWY
jgi:glycosyltransferase involved in cell wall biosynthesis